MERAEAGDPSGLIYAQMQADWVELCDVFPQSIERSCPGLALLDIRRGKYAMLIASRIPALSSLSFIPKTLGAILLVASYKKIQTVIF